MTKQISFDANEQQMYIHILRGHKRLESDLQMGFQRPYAVESMAERVGFKSRDLAYVTCLQQDTAKIRVNTACFN